MKSRHRIIHAWSLCMCMCENPTSVFKKYETWVKGQKTGEHRVSLCNWHQIVSNLKQHLKNSLTRCLPRHSFGRRRNHLMVHRLHLPQNSPRAKKVSVMMPNQVRTWTQKIRNRKPPLEIEFDLEGFFPEQKRYKRGPTISPNRWVDSWEYSFLS